MKEKGIFVQHKGTRTPFFKEKEGGGVFLCPEKRGSAAAIPLRYCLLPVKSGKIS